MNIEMNFMPAADSRFFYVWAYGWCKRSNTDLNIEMNFMLAADHDFLSMGIGMVYMIEHRFEYRNEFHAGSRFAFFYVWAYGWCRRSNIDLNIEMNFMPTADSRFFNVRAYGWL